MSYLSSFRLLYDDNIFTRDDNVYFTSAGILYFTDQLKKKKKKMKNMTIESVERLNYNSITSRWNGAF